jgi:hypothetical protein
MLALIVALAVGTGDRGSELRTSGSGLQDPERAVQELLDRTLALVGGQPITLSDARAAIAFGLIEPDRSAEAMAGVVSRLIDRELVLREVQRYAPAAPSDEAVDARFDEIRKRFADAAALTVALDSHGFTDTRLRAWIRDDLRTQAYLAQRFASASTPSDAEIAQAYARSRVEFDKSGMTAEQATAVVRERLVAARRIELIADWVSDLRRRSDVVVLSQ